MKKHNLVSVIIPVYNAEQFIERAVLSVEQQTLKEIEIICIDDGSSDSSKNILEELQKNNTNLKILEQNHAGAGRARNFGIREAAGEYIAFLDADDIYLDESALEEMVKACKRNGEVICGSFRKEIIDGKIKEVELYEGIDFDRNNGGKIVFSKFQEDLHYQSFIFNRDFLLKNNITFPDYLRYQDPPFFLRALIMAGSFWVVPVYLYCYTLGNICLPQNAEKIKYTLMGIVDNFKIITENNYEILYNKYIYRIECFYRNDILNYMSDEVYQLMKEIVDINNSYGAKRRITILEQLYSSNKVLDDVHDSYIRLKQIIDILTGPYGFKQYFADKGIKTVIVYGIGFFGDVLIRILRDVGVSIVCCIDKKVDMYEDYKVIKPDDILPECDAMIISVKNYTVIKEEYEKKCIVLSFMQIINEIMNEIQ